jgi:hypothetical protein
VGARRAEVQALAAAIEKARLETIVPREPRPRTSNWVTALLDDCGRRVALWRTAAETAKPLPAEVHAGFHEGNVQEDVCRRWLGEHGFRVREDRPAIRSRYEEVNASGRTDFWVDSPESNRPILIEFKAPRSPWQWEKCGTVASMLEDRWLRRWLGQLAFYLWQENEEDGLIVIKRPGFLEFAYHPVAYDDPDLLPLAEAMRANAETAEAYALDLGRYRRAERLDEPSLPPFLPDDPDECRGCAFFGRACFPPLADPGGTELALALGADEGFRQALSDRIRLQAAHKAYEAADAYVKDRVKEPLRALAGTAKSAELLVPGARIVLRKSSRKAYTVAAGEVCKIEIEPIEITAQEHGAFRIEVEPVEGSAAS